MQPESEIPPQAPGDSPAEGSISGATRSPARRPLVFLCCVFAGLGTAWWGRTTPEQARHARYAEVLAVSMKNLRETLPQALNTEMDLIDASSKGMTAIYQLRWKTAPSAGWLEDERLVTYRKSVRTAVCKISESRRFLVEQGGTYRYRVENGEGSFLTAFDVEGSACAAAAEDMDVDFPEVSLEVKDGEMSVVTRDGSVLATVAHPDVRAGASPP